VEVPNHYRSFYAFFMRFALVMLVVGGFAGVLFQEMTGRITFADVPPGVHLETNYRLALVHGHSFLIGAVMPVAWIAILHFALVLGARPVGARGLKWVMWTYVPGTVSVLALLLYKGVHYVAAVKGGERDFDRIHRGIFGGLRLLRGLAYGLSHTVATLGLVIFAVVVWRSLRSLPKADARAS
jgi:hypothetical protein